MVYNICIFKARPCYIEGHRFVRSPYQYVIFPHVLGVICYYSFLFRGLHFVLLHMIANLVFMEIFSHT